MNELDEGGTQLAWAVVVVVVTTVMVVHIDSGSTMHSESKKEAKRIGTASWRSWTGRKMK